MTIRTHFLRATVLAATCSLFPPDAGAQSTLRIFLLLGQSNMEGQAYTYDSPETAGWNVPTMEFLLSGTAAAANYCNNLPFGFEPYLDSSWLEPRSDVWCVHYDSGSGAARNVQPTDDPASIFNGIGPLSPGFGVNTNFGSMIGAELAMGIRLGDATLDPVFLFKSNLGGTTLGNDWRPPLAVAARGGTVGVNYTNTITRFREFLDDLDDDLDDDGMLNDYGNATGYAVSGVYWLQGYNEPLGDAPYTADQLLAEYQDNLVDLIRSIRAADPRIPGGLGLIVSESSDQNATLNAARVAAVTELNGEIPNSAAFFVIHEDLVNYPQYPGQMIGSNWGNNEDGVPFTTGYGYHFNARAENFLEIGWRAGEAALNSGFLAPSPLWFKIPTVSALAHDQATATANLNAAADEVIVVWDTGDKGTAATGDWTHKFSLGAATAGQLEHVLNGLTEGTSHVVRFYATSAALASAAWSPPTTFTTPWLNPPPLLTTPKASAITSQGATLECQLLQGDAEVTLVWAHADQGATDVITWLAAPGGGSHELGATAATTTVTHSLTGLDAATTYVYRFLATNPHGNAWTAAAGFGTKNAGTGGGSASLVAYWDFDDYNETGNNPGGTPQGAHEGWFEDVTGNGHDAFAAGVNGINVVPHDPSGGRFGGAFYSATSNNNGTLAVARHSDMINFDGEDFTIAFWEKAQFRDVAAAAWGPGRGRSQFFTKAPNMIGAAGIEGFGLNLTQNTLKLMGNDSDNFCQETLGGAAYTFPNPAPEPAVDSNRWAHWAIVGVYDGGTDSYTITTYLNGEVLAWNGGLTTVNVANGIIDNPGDLTIGAFWRNNGYASQRFISWSMADGSPEQGNGKGWMDDFAMWASALNDGDIADLATGAKGPLDIGAAPGGLRLSVTHNPATGELTFTWPSTTNGMIYDLVAAANLSTPPAVWPTFAADVTSPFTVTRPASAAAFFALVEMAPTPLLEQDFDGPVTGWTTGHDDANGNTTWELGVPAAGPAAAHSPPNCYGTNLAGDYAPAADTWLRSPVIDLTPPSITGATLAYQQFIDTDLLADFGAVRLLDADAGDAELAVLASGIGGYLAGWSQITIVLPPVALGKHVKVEFRFASDDNAQEFTGFYIDDVVVTRE